MPEVGSSEGETVEAEQLEWLQREPALETPQAIAERRESQLAYTELAPGESETLLKQSFAPQLQAISADPSRLLEDAKLERVDSPTEALATVEGQATLIDSSVPLRATDSEGKLSKVDLGLEKTSQGFVPTNPIVDVQLPSSAAGEIGVGSEGFALRLQGASPKAEARPTEEGGLFAPEAGEDTSLLLAPISGGLELSAILSSRNSPEQLVFDATLPAGAQLRAAADGGAEVVDQKEEVLYRITSPRVVDAQGTAVPATMAVKGGEIVLRIPHRQLDVAYPLLLDPEITENWTNFTDTSKLNYWNWQYGGVGPEDYIGWRSPIVDNWGNGLYVRSRPNFTYPAGSYGRWSLGAPNSTAYFDYVSLGPIHYDAHGCTANEPHGYVGVWNDNGSWSAITNAYPSGWITSFAGALPGGSRTIFVGIGAAASTNIKCGHDYALNGATLYLTDPENPTVSAPSGIPSGWIKQETPLSITVPVSDPGLGVKSAKVTSEAAPSPQELGCTGQFGSTCPSSYNFNFSLSAASFLEGERSVSFSAKDVLEKTSNTQEATLKIDRTKPGLILKGQLAEATEEEGGLKAEEEDKDAFDPLHLAVYDLTIEATDGSTESAATKRSGVKTVEVFLDSSKTPLKTWSNASCPASSCPLTATYPLKLNELSADTHHTLRVVATDFAGNEPREREIGFEYVPATGEKDEYVMQHFPLFDTEAEPEEGVEATGPELAVNLMNGNLVFHQKDVDVPGPAADLEVERFYNSLLPEDQNTEWGDGWTLAQTPTLEAGSPSEGTLVEDTGAVESAVDLPAEANESRFAPRLHAVVTKEPSGYSLTDETGESAGTLQFDESGQVTELQASEYAGVEYKYDAAGLDEIAVNDPGSAGADPQAAAEREEFEQGSTPTFKSAFGSGGSGNGQLNDPADVAVDAKGNLYLADKGNNRIEKFNEKGEYVSKFGTSGSGNGQLNQPVAVAIDSAGNIWVADKGNNRVQKFNEAGEYVSKFGSSGSSNGKFEGPEGIAIDASGNVLVSDSSRVQKLKPSGEWLKTLGSHGHGSGQIWEPAGIDVAAGKVWIADWGNNKVLVFNEAGEFVRQFGEEGTANGQFKRLMSVAVDSSGHVWVPDQENNRVEEFDEEGKYLAQFGTGGSGAGQFDNPVGLAVDNKGSIWIVDNENARVQKWAVSSSSSSVPTYASAFGSGGSGNGQLADPADVAVDSKGNLYLADKGNNRIEKFNEKGEYVSKFGTSGSGNGQLNQPVAVAIDSAGNIWVADKGNNRVQKFNEAGEYVSKFGSSGSSNGKFEGPEGIAIDASGNVLVSDSSRVQKLKPSGEWLKTLGSHGHGSGQIWEPAGIDVAAGKVWIADWGNNKVLVFNEAGEFVRQFGEEGTANGQFKRLMSVAVDSAGKVWVPDQENNRVEEFDEEGRYLAQFGTGGSGAGQFDNPVGLAVDNKGSIWIVDNENARVQKWDLAGSPEVPDFQDDPAVEVDVTGGLVEGVSGEDSGSLDYEHEGELLTAVSGPDGETAYEYDGVGHMTKVELPNGSWAEIEYEATYGRVKAVKVSIEGGTSKTTHFEYTDSPSRSTRVVPDGEAATVYDMAADGSFVRWQNVGKAPEIEDLGGNLVDPEHRETEKAMEPGAYELNVKAFSAEGIAKIEIIANGNIQVDERTCAEDFEKEGVECEHVSDQWIIESANWAPGIVYLEVIVTDREKGKEVSEGHEASERFWVNVPYTPPPDSEGEVPPTYSEIKTFREEFGLDLDLKGNEEAINERIFALIRAWENPNTPTGEVARATSERWGVPLRQVDAAELEWRERYLSHDIPLLDEWGRTHAKATYAGVVVDDEAGGLMRVGFTANQASSIATMKAELPLTAEDRMAAFESAPSNTLERLESLRGEVETLKPTLPAGLVVSMELDIPSNIVAIGATNVAEASSLIGSKVGSGAPFHIELELKPPQELSNWMKTSGPVLAGDFIRTPEGACSAGFGAYAKLAQGRRHYFLLTAAHCAHVGRNVWREDIYGGTNHLGEVARSGWDSSLSGFVADTEAVSLAGPLAAPKFINGGKAGVAKVRSVAPMPLSRSAHLCHSGSGLKNAACGKITGTREFSFPAAKGREEILTCFSAVVVEGDSGGPVWIQGTNTAVGIEVSGRGEIAEGVFLETCAVALMREVGQPGNSAVLSNPALGNIHLRTYEP